MLITLCTVVFFPMLFTLVYSTELHIELSTPNIQLVRTNVPLNQIVPLSPTDVSNSSHSSSNNTAAQQKYISTPPSVAIPIQTITIQPNAVTVTIDIQRNVTRHALVPATLSQENLERLTKWGKAASKKMPNTLPVNDVSSRCVKTLSLLGNLALLYVFLDLSDTTIGLFDYNYFKPVRKLDNYYPFLAIQNGDVSAVFETGTLYLFMTLGLTAAYRAQFMDGGKRLYSFIRGCRSSEENGLLYNNKNARLIRISSVLLGVGSVAFAFYKTDILAQYFNQTVGYFSILQYFALSSWSLSNFFNFFDAVTAYFHPKMREYFNRPASNVIERGIDCLFRIKRADPITASNRTTLLNITQNAIIRWMALSDHEKVRKYNRLFSPQANETDINRIYRILFFLFDFGREDGLIQFPVESRFRKGIRFVSEGAAVAAGYFSFGVIQSGVQSVIDGSLNYFGVHDYDKSVTQKAANVLAGFGSGLVTILSRRIGKSILQVCDAWTGHKNIKEIASSGYISRPELRKYLTTYNTINGSLLGMGEAFAASANGTSNSAAVFTGIASGAVTTLFLQKGTQGTLNVENGSIGAISDEMIAFMRDFRLWVTRMPADVVRDMYTIAVNSGSRVQLMNRLRQNANV